MYVIPNTTKRFVFQAERDATVKTAITAWGKRRSESFFSRFLKYEESPMGCALHHPLAAFRYAFFSRTAAVADNTFISNEPLTDGEIEYVRRLRTLTDDSVFPRVPAQFSR